MRIAKATDADKELFKTVFSDQDNSQVKAMFGNLGAFVNGNMYAGLFGSDIGLRLSDPDRTELMATEGAGPFGPPGRPMKQYVAVPSAWLQADHTLLHSWVARALVHASTLPAKVKKTKKK